MFTAGRHIYIVLLKIHYLTIITHSPLVVVVVNQNRISKGNYFLLLLRVLVYIRCPQHKQLKEHSRKNTYHVLCLAVGMMCMISVFGVL